MARLWSQFREYDLVEVDVRRAEGDSRPESFKPDIDSLERVGHVDGWANRQRYFEQLPRTTTCELRAAVAASHAASSLGMIKVAEAVRLEFEVHPGWSDVEKRKIEAAALLPSNTLFGAPAAIPGTLKHPRFKVRYRYHCQAPDCRGGHEGQILDWELTALQNRLARESDAVLKDAIQQRFALGMFGPNRHTSFFMGNFEDPKKRQNFSVLGGVHYPSVAVASSQTLFGLDEDG